MSSTANLQTDTLGVTPPATQSAADELREQQRKASLTLACHDCCNGARNVAELLEWLDMFGLPPCERPLRTSVGSKTRHRNHTEGKKP